MEVWQTDDGLPQNSITSITETLDGYLWLATFSGLARFDGVRFTSFNDHNAPALTSSSLVRLDADTQGGLWITTDAGGLCRLLNGEFLGFSAREGLPASGVSAVRQAPDGRVWLRDKAGALYRFEGGRFVPVQLESGIQSPLLGSFGFDRDGRLWTKHGATLSYVLNGKCVTLRDPDGKEAVVRALGVGRDGGLVLITAAGLQRYRRGWEPGSVSCPAEMRNLTCVLEDRFGQVWVGTFGHGLFRYRAGTGWRRFQVGEGLLHNTVRSVYEDREGNLWVGTDGAGLHRLKPRLFQMWGPKDGMSGAVVMSVAEGPSGVMWFGLNGGGVNRLESKKLTLLKEQGVDINEYVYSLLPDKTGTLWIGTYDRGLTRFREGKIQGCPSGGPTNGAIFAFLQDHAGNIWAGGNQGLWRFEADHQTGTNPEWRGTHVELPKEGRQAAIRALAVDTSGRLYIGTGGAGVFTLKDEQVKQFTEREGLADNHVSCIYVDGKEVAWVGGAGAGLTRLDGGKMHRFSAKDGLPSDRISCIVEDDRGHLWCGCERGIFCVKCSELNEIASGGRRLAAVRLYGHSDGLRGLECSGAVQPACWKSSDHKLWFATVNGVAVVDPRNLASNRLPPPVVIEEAVFDDQITVILRPSSLNPQPLSSQPSTLNSQPLRSTLKPQPSTPLRLTVPKGVQRVELQYTGLSLTAPDKVHFRYMMEGFENAWVEAGVRRSAQYTAMPPGDYVFRVQACNNDGVWNEAGASLGVVVLPPWWLTWWFRALAIAGVAGLLFGAVEMRLRRVRVQHARERAFSSRLLQSQEEERARIASELHDSLGQDLLVIKNRALLGMKDDGGTSKSSEQFGEISQIASGGLVQVREISRNLRPYQLDRLGLTKSLQAMISRVSSASGIGCEVHIDPLDGLLQNQLEIHLYRIVQELLNNVIKHSQASKACVTATVDPPENNWGAPPVSRQGAAKGRRIKLVVEDDGCGFDLEQERAGNSEKPGMGLGDVGERARLLGGTVHCESRRAQGTVWTIVIPVQENRTKL